MVRSVLPNPDWFNPSAFFCLPSDNGLIYGAMNKIVRVPPKKQDGEDDQDIKIIDLRTKLAAFMPDPNWEHSKRLAVVDVDLIVTIVDFETGHTTHGHRAHELVEARDKAKKNTTAIVFLKQNAVVSSSRSTLVHYCLNTNKYCFHYDFTEPANPFSIFRQSPKDSNLLAGGTKDGLVVIIALDKFQVIRKFRGHEKEISSLDWRYLSIRKPKADMTLAEDIFSTDPTDAFDLYDHTEVPEFGVYGGSAVANRSDDKEDNNRSLKEKLANDEAFNYSEACRSVKRDIQASQGTRKNDGSGPSSEMSSVDGDQAKATFEENKEKYGVRNPNPEDSSDKESLLSNASSNTPDLTEESLNEAIGQPLPTPVQEDEIPVLATGSHEHKAHVWDVMGNEFKPMVTIRWNSKAKSPFPEAYANILFLKDDVILIGNGFGEIEEHKIELNRETRKIILKEKKTKHFSVKAVLSLAKSAAGDILWTSSIYRNVSCFDIPGKYAKIVSLDTIQPRIHCIIENPHDPNIVAVGGNDNRICLWNTSEVDFHFLKMKPFMHKVRNTILTIAWHPVVEQLLAFSTRDGRISLIDTSKANNQPKPLPMYTTKEIYSIVWTKLKTGEVILLSASQTHQLVYFTFSGHCGKTLIEEHRVPEIFGASSLSVAGNILVAGTKDGRLFIMDINDAFNILEERIMSECTYVGMTAWFEDTLAVSTDRDLYLIRDIQKQVKLGLDPIRDDRMTLLPSQHTHRINSVAFSADGKLLISSCNGGLVCIMNIDTEPGDEDTIATISIETPAYCAVFLPSNQNLVVCGGHDCTPLVYKWRNFMGARGVPVVKKKDVKKVHWAIQCDYAFHGNVKKKVKVEELAKVLKGLNIGGDAIATNPVDPQQKAQQSSQPPAPKKKSSVFDLINTEIFDAGLYLVKSMLKNVDHSPGLVEKMFAAGQDGVKELLEQERLNKLAVKTNQSVMVSQLQDVLRTDIHLRTLKGTLTETHVAVAPSVSYEFWKKTCKDYALQCIEQNETLAGVNYLLAVNEYDAVITELCDKKYFREAYVVAKMHKLDENPIFSEIVTKWSDYLIITGQFEAAATIYACSGKFKEAIIALNRRQKKDELINECLRLLKIKTGQPQP